MGLIYTLWAVEQWHKGKLSLYRVEMSNCAETRCHGVYGESGSIDTEFLFTNSCGCRQEAWDSRVWWCCEKEFDVKCIERPCRANRFPQRGEGSCRRTGRGQALIALSCSAFFRRLSKKIRWFGCREWTGAFLRRTSHEAIDLSTLPLRTLAFKRYFNALCIYTIK